MDDAMLMLFYLLIWLTALTIAAFVADVVIPWWQDRKHERRTLRRVIATRRVL